MTVDHDSYEDEYIRAILRRTRTIAMVGASARWVRPSFFAMKYLQHKGYRVIPVNPAAAGSEILDETVYAKLADIPEPFEMIDIFRSSAAAGQVVDDAIGLENHRSLKTIWMQLGVRNDAAAQRAEAAGFEVVMNRCPKIEYGRLSGELSWGGVNSGIITAKPLRL